MGFDIKTAVDSIVNDLSKSHTFDNPFISKSKFVEKLSSKLSKLHSIESIEYVEELVHNCILECISESINETLDSLLEKDMIEMLVNTNGELAYRLKQ